MNNLRRIKSKYGLTARQIAAILKVPVHNVKNWLRGYCPRVEPIEAAVLKTKIEHAIQFARSYVPDSAGKNNREVITVCLNTNVVKHASPSIRRTLKIIINKDI